MKAAASRLISGLARLLILVAPNDASTEALLEKILPLTLEETETHLESWATRHGYTIRRLDYGRTGRMKSG